MHVVRSTAASGTGISRRQKTTAVALTAAALVFAASAPAAAETATVGVTGGTFTMDNPASVSLTAVTLDGTNKTSTGTIPLTVKDNRGTGAGWNITATSTTFSDGATTPKKLATNATSVTGATNACAAGVTCTTATNGISYSALTLPAGDTAPTAVKIFNAAVNTGMADQTVTPAVSVAIPANTFAGSYTSTWTISLVTGP